METKDYFLRELDALQRFLKHTAGLNSFRLQDAPDKAARPVALFEAPWRGKGVAISRYKYVIPVKQYGKLFCKNLDQALEIQSALRIEAEDRDGVLPILDNGVQVGLIKELVAEFDTGDLVNGIPFYISYEVTYTRPVPAAIPAPTKVQTKITTPSGNVITGDKTT